MKKLLLTATIATTALCTSPTVSAAQTTLFVTMPPCQIGLFETCASATMENIAGNLFRFTITNANVASTQKFTSILILLNQAAAATPGNLLPTGWSIDKKPFNGQIWYEGNLCNQGGALGGCPQMYKFDFLNNGKGLAADNTAEFNFTLNNDATPVGFGLHAQGGPNGQSQWIAMGVSGEFGVTQILDPTVVPEPSTYALMASGLLGIFGVARRRRRNA